jgi:hypothetical protein
MNGCGTEKRDGGAPRRAIEVEFLYLDRTACTRCRETEEALRTAVEEARRILAPAATEVSLRTIQVRTAAQARALRLVSSPTVRLNGRDAAPEVRENACAECRGISCRVWTWRGKDYEAPPVPLLLELILREAYGRPEGRPAAPAQAVELPENLKRFFARSRSRRAARPETSR